MQGIPLKSGVTSDTGYRFRRNLAYMTRFWYPNFNDGAEYEYFDI